MSHPSAAGAASVRELERVEWVVGQVPLPGLPVDVDRDRPSADDRTADRRSS